MPLYEYQCNQCGNRLEEMQKFSDAPLVKCPSCGQDALEKLISASGFILKGSGWYKDGYGNPTPKRTEKQVNERLQKAVDDDKKKTATTTTETAKESTTTPAATSPSPAVASKD